MDKDIDALLKGRLFKKYVDKIYAQIREKYDLKQVEIEILYFLCNSANATASTIYKSLSLTKGHVSQAMDTLCQKGFLTPVQDRTDRRCITYDITSIGRQAVAELGALKENTEKKLLSGVTDSELHLFIDVAEKICGNMEAMLIRKS
ncbi:MAG: winged helix-turn-helix transcriptional regulator [Clostridia bacterium]|nr:winged helix-turn-helix transcriptional regulator [Clostridia bacterium]